MKKETSASSLRKRLLILLLAGTGIFWLVVGMVSYHNAHHEVDELLDVQMSQVAHTLLALLLNNQGLKASTFAWPDSELGSENDELEEENRLLFQLLDGQGHMLMRTPDAPPHPMTTQEGFSETDDEKGHWRYLSIRDPAGKFQVLVGQDHAVRDEMITDTVTQVMLPILLCLPLLGLWVWHAISHGLQPLTNIRRELALRRPDYLAELPEEATPPEIQPLVQTLNHLLQRVEQALETERRFTADAAHELRTPLAALRAQLQVAQRARSPEEGEHALAQMQTGLLRASRLVEQMLQLARLDPERSLPQSEVMDLVALTQSVCADQGGLALDKDLDLSLEAPLAVLVQGSPDWLRVLIRNLVDNAIRYTPTGGKVMVSLGEASSDHGPILQVADSGPGIPLEQRQAALRRFHRLDTTGQTGHGLGLSIVTRIAELHGATLSLEQSPQLGGLAVTLYFPLVPLDKAADHT